MRLVNCRDCNHKVSVNANVCPNCGAPVMLYAWQRAQNQGGGGCIGLALLLVLGAWMFSNVYEDCQESAKREAANKRDAAVSEDPAPLIERARVSIERGELVEAQRAIQQLNRVRVAHGLDAAYKAKEEALRLEGIRAAIASKDCEAWEASWGKLREIKATEVTAEATAAATRLERCRLDAIKAREERLAVTAIEARKQIKAELDEVFLSDGLDVTIKTQGAAHTTIRLTNVLFENRVIIKRYTDDGLLSKLSEAGFKKAIFSNGKTSHTYELEPEPLDHKAENLSYWRERSLDLPLALPGDAAK